MQTVSPAQLAQRARERPAIAEIAPLIGAFGAEVYLVGGTVRDLILGRELIDVDLAVDGDTNALASTLGPAEPLSESRFSTLRLQRNGVRYDLARTRSESYPHPGALPQVEPAGIDADLLRRDFTINAIALGLAGPRAGQLLAPPGAIEDLEAQRLAVLHEHSFVDDPTRLFRLARYSARLGFEPARRTRELAAEAISSGALHTISGTRIGNELRLLAAEPDPVAAFQATAALGLPWSIEAELAREALGVLPADGRAELVVLACVFRGRSREALAAELDELGFTAADREAIVQAATIAAALAGRLSGARSRSEIANAVGTAGIETVALAFSQGAPSQALTWLRELRQMKPLITGEDLLRAGIAEGPAIGRALQAAKEAMLDGRAPDRESQLAIAPRAAR